MNKIIKVSVKLAGKEEELPITKLGVGILMEQEFAIPLDYYNNPDNHIIIADHFNEIYNNLLNQCCKAIYTEIN